MAALYHFPTFNPFPLQKLHCSFALQLAKFSFTQQPHNQRSYSRIYASSLKKSRASRKVKSNEDLLRDIRDFLSSVGLPEDIVPSTKVLSQHGRRDLANIVRRRGYKFIGQLLETPFKTNSDVPNIDAIQAVKLEMLTPSEEMLDERLEVLAEVEGPQERNFYDSKETDEELGLKDQIPFRSVSLKEKVAKFIEHGELDAFEEWIDKPEEAHVSEVLSGRPEKINGNGPVFIQDVEQNILENSISCGTNYITISEQPSNNVSHNVETQKMENQAEIKHLKFLLHQKELELLQLKGLIEKEKLTLSALQAKAEMEISKAHKLVSEKETELLAVEENLSGLKEVEIQYSAEGEIVELAGSFSGWCDTIKMDPRTALSPTVQFGSRAPRIWRVVLWLYPGVYEIKFVVDGNWQIDPGREFITRSNIQNNILRVKEDE